MSTPSSVLPFPITVTGWEELGDNRPQEVTVCVCVRCRAVWPEPICSKMCPLTNRSQNIKQPGTIKGGPITTYMIFGNKVNKVQGTAWEQGIVPVSKYQQQQRGHLTPLHSLTASLITLLFFLLLPMLNPFWVLNVWNNCHLWDFSLTLSPHPQFPRFSQSVFLEVPTQVSPNLQGYLKA